MGLGGQTTDDFLCDHGRSAFVIVYVLMALISGGVGFVLGLVVRG